jgi:hypothetical protein
VITGIPQKVTIVAGVRVPFARQMNYLKEHEMIHARTLAHPQAPALSFFLHAQAHRRTRTRNYVSLLACISATTNV